MKTPNAQHLVQAICHLQEQKEQLYGVDWKRFGFVSSFFNIFRKFIRFRTMWYAGWQPSQDDSRLDTLIDLLNYLLLSMLLHAAQTPKAFQVFLSWKKEACGLSPEYFVPNEQGFKRFCELVLLPDMHVQRPVQALKQLAPQIISAGEQTVEAWLAHVASVSARLDAGEEGNTAGRRSLADSWFAQLKMHNTGQGSGFGNGDPYLRLCNVYDMVLLCAQAALAHAAHAQDEWEAFLAEYGENTSI